MEKEHDDKPDKIQEEQYIYQSLISKRIWEHLTLKKPGEALLVRPDDFVALRLSAKDFAEFLISNLHEILGL